MTPVLSFYLLHFEQGYTALAQTLSAHHHLLISPPHTKETLNSTSLKLAENPGNNF